MEADGIRAMVRWLGLAPEAFVRGLDRQASATPGPIKVDRSMRRFDTSALYRLLDDKRKREGLSWKDVAAAIGDQVSPDMLTRLRERPRIDVNLMVSATAWVGVPIESVTYEP
jgi:hypothetical protein